MNQVFLTIVSCAFFLWAIRSTLYWVALWQDKEYRLDRLLVHLKETTAGKHVIFSYGNIVKWILLLSYFVIIFTDGITSLYEYAIGIVFLIQAADSIKNIVQHRIKRPVLTYKAILLVMVSILFIGIVFFFRLTNTFVWLLLVDKLIPLIVSLFVFFLAFPTEIHRDMKMQQATTKMREYTNVLVIAVSGSYGKTSTKEYIAQVLAKKFHVVKTPLSNNTPIGIATTILRSIKDDTEVFVVEMGAYKRGEIAELTHMVPPAMSVTTAVSDQHISLYGSTANVIASEYELIHALPKNGISLFNGNNKGILPLYEQTKNKKIMYKWYETEPKKKHPICAYNITATTRGVNFIANSNGQEFVCKSPLLGIHTVENILPAIFFADHLGMKRDEIVAAIAELIPPTQTLNRKKLRNGVLGVDDTFNVSPESVLSAMEYITLYKKQKFFVLSPLTELGTQAKKRYIEIGQTAGRTCDHLFLLHKNYAAELQEGIQAVQGVCQIHIGRPEKLATIIAAAAKKDDVVLFEGKEAKMVMKKLV